MNNIWYPLIKALQNGYDVTKIQYRVRDRIFYDATDYEGIRINGGAHHISPLLEHVPRVLYDPDGRVTNDEKFGRIDVNPYYRFGPILEPILSPERSDPNDLVICDIIMHLLAHIDRICGMSKRDFRILLMMEEIDAGWYGDTDNAAQVFNVVEKRALAEALIMLYETSNCIRCLDSLFSMIMTDFKLWIRNNEEMVFYYPYEFNEQEDKKLRFIIKLFLPVDLPYVVHWRHTFGMVGSDNDIILEEWVI